MDPARQFLDSKQKHSLLLFIDSSDIMKLSFLVLFTSCIGVGYGQQSVTKLTAATVINDNKLVSRTDSAVHAAAQGFMSAQQAVGLSVGIYQSGKMYEYNYGESIKGSGRLPNANSLYAIASVTKTFTANLLAQAVVEKRVSLNDDIRQYIDGNFPNLEYQGNPIRLVHLINHRSGLPFLLPNIPEILTDTSLSMTDIAQKINRPIDRKVFFQSLKEIKLGTAPGTKSMYSNAGVQLLGFVLEKVYNMPFEDLLNAKILQPLQMRNTKIALTSAERQRLAKAYDEKGNTIPANTSTFWAAGGISSTINDMLQYIRWQVGEKEEALRLAHGPVYGDFNPYAVGLNWQMLKDSNARILWQDGNMIGYSSLCVLHPDLDLGMIVLTNQMDRSSAGRIVRLVNQITEAIAPKAIKLP